ncbi:hypothetical protein DSECCO2_649980 [anaerobic digester metagenome]
MKTEKELQEKIEDAQQNLGQILELIDEIRICAAGIPNIDLDFDNHISYITDKMCVFADYIIESLEMATKLSDQPKKDDGASDLRAYASGDEYDFYPVGNENLTWYQLQGVPFRYLNDDLDFEVYYKGKWCSAESIDFDFK